MNPATPQTPQQPVRRGAIGIAFSDACLLMVRRAPGVPKGGFWCFPGGHVERGETSRRAVQREFHEELGILVEPVRRLGSLRVADSRHILVAWMVEHVSGEINLAPAEIDCYRWVPASEARIIAPGLPSNSVVFDWLGL